MGHCKIIKHIKLGHFEKKARDRFQMEKGLEHKSLMHLLPIAAMAHGVIPLTALSLMHKLANL